MIYNIISLVKPVQRQNVHFYKTSTEALIKMLMIVILIFLWYIAPVLQKQTKNGIALDALNMRKSVC